MYSEELSSIVVMGRNGRGLGGNVISFDIKRRIDAVSVVVMVTSQGHVTWYSLQERRSSFMTCQAFLLFVLLAIPPNTLGMKHLV